VSRVIRLELAYEGTRFSGFGLQPGRLTVQGVLEEALAGVLGEPVRVTAAGRTDAGVHARRQVVSFATSARLPAAALGAALRSRLPEDVIALGAGDADPAFDARRCAVRRHYRYSIWTAEAPSLCWRRFSLHWTERLDEERMNAAAAELTGRHDFSSFIGRAAQEPAERSAVRTVARAGWRRRGDLLHFECSADAFARHMVRNMVGTLLWVGRGRLAPADVSDILAARDRRAAGPTAPARGLTLMQVDYDQESQR
jgi:tRNA pseudouridine38-40 synthase